jgi:dienelactone hydrolase
MYAPQPSSPLTCHAEETERLPPTQALWLKQLYCRLLLLLVLACFACSAIAQDAQNLEKPLCWGFVEQSLFDTWRQSANKKGRPNKHAPGVSFQEQTFTTHDQKQIYGYRAYAETAVPEQQDAIVIVPGNAMLADQIYRFAAYFARRGRVAYVFDYRGYGGSTGAPYANAIIDDYRRILSFVSDRGHGKTQIYALSFGGIVTLAALANARPPGALVLDGVPSKLPWYAFCPSWLDPFVALKNAPKRTLILSGTKDPVVSPDETAALRRKALELGMKADLLEGFSHPGLDESKLDKRLDFVTEFFK